MKTLLRHGRCALLLGWALTSGAAMVHAQALYWLDTNYPTPTLNVSDPNGLGVQSLALSAGTLPEGLAAEITGELYFTESAWTNAHVNRGAINLSQVMPIVSGGSALRGIAVDPAAQLIYWTASNLVTGAALYRSSTTGASPTLLATLPPGANPRGIAIDHSGGKLYWTDFDLNAIYRANLDGTGMTAWLPLLAGEAPYGIAFEAASHSIYWTEYGAGLICRAPTGGPPTTTLVIGLTNPTYLALDPVAGRMFWVDGNGSAQRLNRANLNGSSAAILPPVLTTYGGLAYLTNTTSAAPGPTLPAEFALKLWPTPSGGEVHVAFELPRPSVIRLRVFDLQGREVATLADESMPPGRYERTWSGKSRGRLAPAGVYVIRMEVEGRSLNRRIVITP
jgi:hypothetical protein